MEYESIRRERDEERKGLRGLVEGSLDNGDAVRYRPLETQALLDPTQAVGYQARRLSIGVSYKV